LIQNTERRTEAFSKALSDLEREFREQGLEQQRIFQQIQGRLREQNLKDSQMEAMIERYNTTLSHFENKISVISTRLSEKDMTLMSYRKIMEKIVDEVERLKSSRFVQSRHPQI
jgi:chromosome segregation ATPase